MNAKVEIGIFVIAIVATSVFTRAYPQPSIGAASYKGADNKRNGGTFDGGSEENSIEDEGFYGSRFDFPTTKNGRRACGQSLDCGWALYQTSDSRFRPIISYTKNVLCDCAEENRCVLVNNRPEQKLYIFKCRHRDSVGELFPFPSVTSRRS